MFERSNHSGEWRSQGRSPAQSVGPQPPRAGLSFVRLLTDHQDSLSRIRTGRRHLEALRSFCDSRERGAFSLRTSPLRRPIACSAPRAGPWLRVFFFSFHSRGSAGTRRRCGRNTSLSTRYAQPPFGRAAPWPRCRPRQRGLS